MRVEYLTSGSDMPDRMFGTQIMLCRITEMPELATYVRLNRGISIAIQVNGVEQSRLDRLMGRIQIDTKKDKRLRLAFFKDRLEIWHIAGQIWPYLRMIQANKRKTFLDPMVINILRKQITTAMRYVGPTRPLKKYQPPSATNHT